KVLCRQSALRTGLGFALHRHAALPDGQAPRAHREKQSCKVSLKPIINLRCCSHGAVRRPGCVAPHGVNAPQGRGYNIFEKAAREENGPGFVRWTLEKCWRSRCDLVKLNE